MAKFFSLAVFRVMKTVMKQLNFVLIFDILTVYKFLVEERGVFENIW